MKNITFIFFLLFQLSTLALAGTQTIIKADITEGQETVSNFLKEKGHFEKNANGVIAYKDAASPRPIDGTGGSPSITCTRTAINPIFGDGSLLVTKSATNLQGEGCSIQFKIDAGYQAKVLQIEMDYKVVSGAFVAGNSSNDSDLIVYIYDVTNSKLIEPTSIKFLSSSTNISDRFVGNFQTSATGTTYNLIIHNASISALAYSLSFDKIEVKPSRYVYGTPITDWQRYYPTIVGFGSPTNEFYSWRRSGNSLEVIGKFTAGSSTITEARLPFPNGLLSSPDLPTISLAGYGTLDVPSALSTNILREPSVSYFTIARQSASSAGLTKIDGNSAAAMGDGISFNAQTPIFGWSSSTQVSDSFDSNLISVIAGDPVSGITSTPSDITNWNSITQDTTGAFNPLTGVITIPSQGTYVFSGAVLIYGAVSSSDLNVTLTLAYASNSVIRKTLTRAANGNTNTSVPFNFEYPLNAGDQVKLRIDANMTGPFFNAGSDFNFLNVSKKQSSKTISLNERVSFAADTSITSASVSTPFIYTNVTDNTHGAYSVTTGIFTAPVSGFYFFRTTNYTSATLAEPTFVLNGVLVNRGPSGKDASTTTEASYATPMKAGDTMEIRPNTFATAAGDNTLNNFSGFLVK